MWMNVGEGTENISSTKFLNFELISDDLKFINLINKFDTITVRPCLNRTGLNYLPKHPIIRGQFHKQKHASIHTYIKNQNIRDCLGEN